MEILVVDDDRAVREALERALSLEGFDVELAADGAEALAAVERRQPDAIVLDVLMPGVDGLEVCRLLRKAQSRVPILMLTVRDEPGDHFTLGGSERVRAAQQNLRQFKQGWGGLWAEGQRTKYAG